MRMPTACKRLAYTAAALFASLCCAAAPTDKPTFTVAVIPDTQNYADYRHQKAEGFAFDAAEIFLGQMRYIAANAANAGGDIVFATAVGDMWQHGSLLIDPEHEKRGFKRIDNPYFDPWILPTEKTRSFEMPLIRNGYRLIAGVLPFSVVPGNHDYDAQWTDSRHPAQPDAKDFSGWGVLHVGGVGNFQSVFSDRSEFFRKKSWYVSSHQGGADSAQIFSAGGYRFLHIGLQFDAPDDSLAWAASVIRRYPGLPTIVSTHNYLDPSGERRAGPGNDNSLVDPQDNNPQQVWETFISRHDQIFMVLCGHRTSNGLRIEPNRSGHPVYQILSDYQSRQQTAKAAGVKPVGGGIGDGWLRLMQFDMSPAEPAVHVRTYSTHYGKFSTELSEYAQWYKADEQPALTDEEFGARDDFKLRLEGFRERFGAPR